MQKIMVMLYVVSALIMVRSIFRVVEYIMGSDGYLLKNDWILYVFGAALTIGVVGMLAWRYPDGLHPMTYDDPDVELEYESTLEPHATSQTKHQP